jgi:flagellar biosynthesis/type III secretory pathway protein FliH
MIKATLRPASTPSTEDIVASAASVLRTGSATALTRTKKARERALRFLGYARRSGFRQGYQRGLEAAREELAHIAAGVRHEYAALRDAALQDTRDLALSACEELLGLSDPSLILPWLDQAVELAKSSRPITVRVKRRYHEAAASHLIVQHAAIHLVEAPAGQEEDFVVVAENGEVGFAWRSVLRDMMGGAT